MHRLTTREGINAISAQCLGNAAAGLQTGLLQCSGGAPGVKCIIRLFPAWHMKHNTEFELFARDGFRVRAAVEDQVIASVVITSTFGGESLFANPWGGAARVSSVDGEELLEGELLRLDTRSGLDYTIAEAIG